MLSKPEAEVELCEKWILMYIDRWLTAEIVTPNGEIIKPHQGVPQGSVIGLILMNLFMHYAFDLWMQRENPSCQFARYAVDAAVHCNSLAQAESQVAMKAMRAQIRSWKLHRRSDLSLEDIAQFCNPVIKGWWNYYARFYKSEVLASVIRYFHKKLMQWVRRKYHKLKGRRKASRDWLVKATKKAPRLLFSARLAKMPLAG